MSVYADYNFISQYYDSERTPNGAHHYFGLIYSLSGKTKESLNLLDMGCGTGNHVKVLLDQGLGKATVFDANTGMLEVSKKKLEKYISDGRVELSENKLPNLPYDDNTFDVVMSNQVLHHLVTPYDDDKHSNVDKAVAEAFRVLKPNGVLILNLTTPAQVQDGMWWYHLYPENTKDTVARVLDAKTVLSIIKSAGFTREGMIVEPLDTIYTEKWHDQIDGPLSAEWRNIDSAFATCPETEIEAACKLIKELKSTGKLEEYVKKLDASREKVGQYSIFYGLKQA